MILLHLFLFLREEKGRGFSARKQAGLVEFEELTADIGMFPVTSRKANELSPRSVSQGFGNSGILCGPVGYVQPVDSLAFR